MWKNPLFMIDYYKAGHAQQQINGVNTIYSTWTARYNKYHGNCKDTVVCGHQGFAMEYGIEYFNNNFFNRDIDEIVAEYETRMKYSFSPAYTNSDRFRKLHALGYLPIAILSVPEGTVLPINVPQAAMYNTHPDFGWLPQFLEDLWACHNWLPSTSATTAYYRRKDLIPYFEETSDNPTNVKHICGDFSLRGMTGSGAAYASSFGHLLSFDRSATVDANGYAEQYYGADPKNPIGIGIPSLEHSVVCQGIAYFRSLILDGTLPEKYTPYMFKIAGENWDINLQAEMCYMIYLLTEVQPKGALSYVSDTYDYWGVLTKILPVIRDIIISRDGKLIIRPDSGTPFKIVCGDPEAETLWEREGSIIVLARIFGVQLNSKGFWTLDSHIGLIYGDAISAEVALQIAQGLKDLGYSIDCIALGIGAYTYQYVTRDTRGYAIKATNCIHNELGEVALYKDPKTDSGKKSQRGCVVVMKDKHGRIVMEDGFTLEEALNHPKQLMRVIFKDSKCYNLETVEQIRKRLWGEF